ncbi:peptidylprolyl isomerase [Bifidobacterium sp. DSM 109958]|uniref:peptidylprolyl isomerase n=1 Tax=Bifidobacterium moraviense TaxID=2675323 RepID=A0A7Y0HYB6_9BIFI|nr:FKBP-type peptidyl-prolyl cis-trans isomerase [Bifidobacterium sp. DSM 109958]NMN01116.1 peptidylprolyl isomerase [Bifidobacterium sp. DSM 109958]
MRYDSAKHILSTAAAAVCALAMTVGLAACGGSGNTTASASGSSSAAPSSSSASSSLVKMTGIKASGEVGQKPTITFDSTPYTVPDGGYAILQEGNGDTLEEGDRICMQSVAISAKTGAEIYSSWENATPDCAAVLDSSQLRSGLLDVFKGQKVGMLIAMGVNDTTATDDAQKSYVMASTVVSKSRDLTRAEGDAVTDVPSNLPKVTLDGNGKPSIDINGYQSDGTLVAQPLIKGKGAQVTSSSTAVVKYTGWLLDGTQFDSSWDKNTTFNASMSGGVFTGWTEGLTGQTVGSQVLLVVPPDKGYGSTAQGSIPANSTLVFVVDILAAY